MGNTLEERLESLEERVEQLSRAISERPAPQPAWKRIIGVYADDPDFDDAVRLGREWRESSRPGDGEVAPL